MPQKLRICYIVDSLGWIQAGRANDLQIYLPNHELIPMLPSGFMASPPYEYDAVWLASWRILLAHRELGGTLPLNLTLASVTSHYNIGGGLKPETCFRKGADPDEEFQKAIATLKQFRVVTCNSKILLDRLQPHLPNVILAQNGVDAFAFAPTDTRGEPGYRGDFISVGWIGKDKGAKNWKAYEEAAAALAPANYSMRSVVLGKSAKPTHSRLAMIRFYEGLDFFACTSYHDGTPNGLLEAAACGLPAITTAVGNAPELIREGETGWFIEPTAESLIACVERLQYLEPYEYRRMSEAIRAEVEANWTWEKRAGAYRKALEVVCR